MLNPCQPKRQQHGQSPRPLQFGLPVHRWPESRRIAADPPVWSLLRHESRCVGGAGADDIYADSALPEVHHPDTRKRSQRSLGSAIDAQARYAFHGSDGSVQDDGTAVIEVGERLLDCKQCAFHIGCECRVILLFSDTSKRCKRATASIGKEHVTRFPPVTSAPFPASVPISCSYSCAKRETVFFIRRSDFNS